MLKLTTPLVQRRVQVSKEVLRLEKKRNKAIDKQRRLTGKLAVLESDITAFEAQIADGKTLIAQMVELEDKLSTNKPAKE